MNLFSGLHDLATALRHAEYTAVGIALGYPLWRCFVDWCFGRRR